MSEQPSIDADPELGFSLATAWETVAATVPDAAALVHGDLERTWAEFEDRSARLAAHLERTGIGHDAKVACYLYNGPEYLEATFAAFKVRAVPINVNYRYLEAEFEYLLDNSDARGGGLRRRVRRSAGPDPPRLDEGQVLWLCVGADAGPAGSGVGRGYESTIARSCRMPAIERSGDDLWFLYTGGTTGMPKGVMWPHRNLLATAAATFAVVKRQVPSTPDAAGRRCAGLPRAGPRAVRLLPAAPLMHGTSAITAVAVLSAGGTVVTLDAAARSTPTSCAPRCSAPCDHPADDRGRRVRQADRVGAASAAPSRPALRPVVVEGRRVLRRDVVGAGEGGVAGVLLPRRWSTRWAPPRAWDSRARSPARARPEPTARSRLGEYAQGVHRGGRRGDPRLGRTRPAGGRRADPHRLLQGPRQDGRDVPHLRRSASGRSPATGRPSRPTARSSCSVGARCASTPLVRRSTPKRSRRP